MRGQSDPELKKYLWVVICTQKDRKLQTLIEVCTDFAILSPSVNIHRPAEQAFAVEEDDDSEEMFAMMDRMQWTGQGVTEPAIAPSLSQMPSLEGWDTRCDRLLVGQTNRRDFHEHCSPPDRDIAHLFGRDATSPKSSVSAAVRWDIRNIVAQSRIRLYRSSHRVGTCSRMINYSGTPIPHRETPFRPHLNRSECHTSGLRFIITP